MIRTFNEQYPSLQEKQVDFRKALVSMVNARKYLESGGFIDVYPEAYPWIYIKGTILRSDGVTLDSNAFFGSKNKTKLLESMVSGDMHFTRPSFGNYHPYGGIVKSSLGKRGYEFHLSVRDTTKSPNPLTWFSSAKRFAFYYEISLVKDIIENPDNEEFEKHIKGLREASRKDTLTKQEGTIQITPANNLPSSLVDPWSIDIPKIENIAHNRRSEEK